MSVKVEELKAQQHLLKIAKDYESIYHKTIPRLKDNLKYRVAATRPETFYCNKIHLF